MKAEKAGALLDVMICTLGHDGIRRVAEGSHPRMKGVRYIVAWQVPDGDEETPEELRRDDFMVAKTPTRGLSRNRNVALSHATAPLLLISDDDVDYTEEGLGRVIDAFDANPDCDILTFRYVSAKAPKYYPDGSCDLSHPAKGYYPTSFEIAMRRESLPPELRFDENFGIGATFPSGEEDLFLHDALSHGLRGRFLPTDICRHDGDTTADRLRRSPSLIEAKGAIVPLLYPGSWPLRMLLLAMRSARSGDMPLTTYLKAWLRGRRKARKLGRR